MSNKDDLYKSIIDAVVAFDEEKVKELARKVPGGGLRSGGDHREGALGRHAGRGDPF